ncbi:hypothetical protein ES288_D02G189100v1 [Gossypium darwinii]|uniref:Uncharacterized protein n=1 Tax=Gossypium darwinii TaxID=34276 RepID=A0A5D2DHU3_GOSDA|nr:hypothetical protein ES288_D02G189100v1 [Gossypium darwinii]
MGSGSKKDLRVFRVGPKWSLNTIFLFFSSELFLIEKILAMVRKKGEQAHLESAVQWRVVCCIRDG